MRSVLRLKRRLARRLLRGYCVSLVLAACSSHDADEPDAAGRRRLRRPLRRTPTAPAIPARRIVCPARAIRRRRRRTGGTGRRDVLRRRRRPGGVAPVQVSCSATSDRLFPSRHDQRAVHRHRRHARRRGPVRSRSPWRRRRRSCRARGSWRLATARPWAKSPSRSAPCATGRLNYPHGHRSGGGVSRRSCCRCCAAATPARRRALEMFNAGRCRASGPRMAPSGCRGVLANSAAAGGAAARRHQRSERPRHGWRPDGVARHRPHGQGDSRPRRARVHRHAATPSSTGPRAIPTALIQTLNANIRDTARGEGAVLVDVYARPSSVDVNSLHRRSTGCTHRSGLSEDRRERSSRAIRQDLEVRLHAALGAAVDMRARHVAPRQNE